MPTPSNLIATTSSSCLSLLLGLTCALAACDRFPRNNPLYQSAGSSDDEDGGVGFDLMFAERRPLIDDQVAWSVRNNGNRRAEPGETLRLQLYVNWSDESNHTVAYLGAQPSPDDRCVYSVTPPATTTQLLAQDPGVVATATVGPFEVQLRPEPCEEGRAEFTVDVEDLGRGQDYTLTARFAVDALSGQLALRSMNVVGVALPGESIILQPQLANVGSALLRNLVLQVPASATCLLPEFSGEWVPLGDLQPGEQRLLATDALTATVDERCAAGDTLELPLALEDASGQAFSLLWSQVIE